MQSNEKHFLEFQQTSLSRLEEIERELVFDENGQVLANPSNESIIFLSYFYMPKTPWVTDKLHSRAIKILNNIPKDRLDELEISKLVNLEFSSLSPLDKINVNRRPRNLMNKKKMLSNISKAGLIPQLGYSSTLDLRNTWRSESSYAISSLFWFLKVFVTDEKSFRVHSRFVTSAILNLMDFSEFDMKILSFAVFNVLLNSIKTRNNYLVTSGLYVEFMDTISIGFSYLPPSLITVESCIPLLDTCFDTYLKLIEKCYDDNEAKIDILTELISDEIFDKCTISVFPLDQSAKISILNVYLKYIFKIISLLLKCNRQAIYLILRDLLRKILLNILIDSFLFMHSIEIVQCEDGASNSMDFINIVFKLLIEIIQATPQRIQKYKFEILTAIVLFAEKFEMEIMTDFSELQNVRSDAKIVEIDEIIEDMGHTKLDKDSSPTSEEITNISQNVKKVLRLILESNEENELKGEIICKKPFMKKYFAQ